MLSLEQYIEKRKKEDGLNEFDEDIRMENLKTSVNYVFDYYHQYLRIHPSLSESLVQNEKLEKFRKQLRNYDNDTQEWLIEIYDNYNKHIHRSIIHILKNDPLFLLYYDNQEFKTAADYCYIQLIEENPFLIGQKENILLFIKDYHRINSEKEHKILLTDEIDDWVKTTWNKYKVNLWAFVEKYLNYFSNDESFWPATHKIKTNDKFEMVWYEHRQENNLFNIDQVFSQVSNKPFMREKKQQLEVMLMYEWLHSFSGDDDNYWAEYFSKYLKDIDD